VVQINKYAGGREGGERRVTSEEYMSTWDESQRKKHRWKETIRRVLQSCSLNWEDASDRFRWRSL